MCFEETKEPFMEQLQEVINNIPNNDIDILFITGDFNAKFGRNNNGHESAL